MNRVDRQEMCQMSFRLVQQNRVEFVDLFDGQPVGLSGLTGQLYLDLVAWVDF